jgi:hypothetical protein
VKRRTFIKGAVAAAVSAALPALPSDGYQYTYQTFKVASPAGTRYAAALARSMMQTREIVAANVFERAFADYDSSEGARRSVGVEGSPDRI